VRGYAAAASETALAAGHGESFAGDLAAFSRALTSHSGLRDVLVDDAVPPALRVAIVTDLLEGRAGAESAAVVRFAVRYELAPELPLSLGELVELAEAATTGGAEAALARPEPAGGRGEVRERIRGYADRALSELADSADIDVVEDELFGVARALDAHPELRRVLADPAAELAGRLAIVDQLLGGRVRPATLRLVRYVLRAGHVRDLIGTLEWLVELAALERGRRVAEVRLAVPLEDAERTRLATALGRLVDRPVEVREVIDANVIGGMLVTLGDLVIDGTVRLRLERLRDLLVEAR